MCQLCGCKQYIKQGKQAILRQAIDMVNKLKLNVANVDDYEATEIISFLIAPLGSKQTEVYQTAVWISGLHEGVPRAGQEERYQKYERAFREIFAILPVKGSPKNIATDYHQLEQLVWALDKGDLNSLDEETRKALLAVKHVHDDLSLKTARLKDQYKLS
jgi:hypothetical protein